MKKIVFFLLISTSIFMQSCKTDTPQNYKVMTYNIRYDNSWDTINHWNLRKQKVVQLINFYKPDILGVQEALHQPLQYLDKELKGYNFVGVGREDGQTKGEYAPIFYNVQKWKLLRQNTFWLSETPDKVSVGWDAVLERICTYALLEDKKSGKKVWVFNTHFDHQGEKARENSATLLLTKIEELNTEKYPMILMGDFNSKPESKPIQKLIANLDWKLKENPQALFGPRATYNDFNMEKVPNVWIDYIFTRSLKVSSYTHLDHRLDNTRYISDHFPVLVEFEL